MFADTRTAQEGDGVIQLTVPKDVVEELEIEVVYEVETGVAVDDPDEAPDLY